MRERENGPSTDEWVEKFEQMANESYQANAARVALDVLLEKPNELSESLRYRLLNACDKGMEVNPKNCKEYLMFGEFKKRLKTAFTEE